MQIVILMAESEFAMFLILIAAMIASALIGAILGLIISVFSKKRARRDVFRRARRGLFIGLIGAIATAAATMVTLRLLKFAGRSDS